MTETDNPNTPRARRRDLIAAIGFSSTQIFIIIAFLVSVGISVADWVGLLESGSELRKRIPIMTLLLVSVIAVYLLQERKQEHSELREAVSERDDDAVAALKTEMRSANTEQTSEFTKLLDAKGLELVGAMKGVFVHPLKGQAEYYERLTREILRAERTVEDLTWGKVSPAMRSTDEEAEFSSYLEAVPALCRSRPGVRVREIFTFPDLGRVNRLQAMLDQKLPNYWTKYFEVNHAFLPPLMQFTIIDRKLVIFGTHRGALGYTEGESYVAIQHPLIAEKFSKYFAVLWAAASPIRDGHTENVAALVKIRDKLTKKGTARGQ